MNNTDTEKIFMAGLKEEFMGNMAAYLPQMEALIKENEFEKIRWIAHDIKGTAGAVGFDEGTQIAKQLLFAAHHEDVEKTKELIDQLKEYMKTNGLDI